ncbi:MAG: discoidin domain-containing protein, partial [Bacteroidales bacterium]|nr:discoidin domain-containing protein [Bacteroidales bacterium]
NAVKIDKLTGKLISEGLPFFPFGFYTYSPVQEGLIAQEVTSGFNMMSPYQKITKKSQDKRKAYMDRCAQVGMKVNYNLLSVAGGGGVDMNSAETKRDKKLKLLEKEINRFKDHPALLSWYISDEPTGRSVEKEWLEKIYRTVKRIDPYHPVSIVFMNEEKAGKYRNAMDIVMTDPYPVPNHPVAEVEEPVSYLKKEFFLEKPVWMVPQAFGGNEWWQREPTGKELRAMTWLSILNGATGVQYFIRHGLNSFPKSTTAWNEAGEIALEIKQLVPWLTSDHHPRKLNVSDTSVLAKSYQADGERIIIAQNRVKEPKRIQIELREELLAQDIKVLFENRTLQPENGIIHDFIDGFGTRIYKLGKKENPVDSTHILYNPGFEKVFSPGVPAGCYAKVRNDKGATYFVDSRVSHSGRHSLKMIAPSEKESIRLKFYPVKLHSGNSYVYTLYAKAAKKLYIEKPERNFFQKLFGIKKPGDSTVRFKMALGWGEGKEFTLNREWRPYRLIHHSNHGRDVQRISPRLWMTSSGKAWFDDMEVTQDPKILLKQSEENLYKVSFTTLFEDAELRYTLDGSQPNTSSELFKKPFTLEKPADIKASAFRGDSLLTTASMSVFIHKAAGKEVKYVSPYKKYTAGGDKALTDGLTGSSDYKDGKWQGFIGKDMEVVIDLGTQQNISTIKTRFLHHPANWIFRPKKVTVKISEDGENFSDFGSFDFAEADKELNTGIYPAVVKQKKTNARYVKISADAYEVCPQWHKGAGNAAWLFLDEIVVF